jgi:hypothetical protein
MNFDILTLFGLCLKFSVVDDPWKLGALLVGGKLVGMLECVNFVPGKVWTKLVRNH